MKKDPERTEARKAEIADVALKLFFAKGYDGTSIHMIQKALGKEVGLFYYYFSSKDEVFEAAINLFFVSYEAEMRRIVDEGKENPRQELTRYINYINMATQDFRRQYLGKLHWSILGAIREHTMLIMKKYIREILEYCIRRGMLDHLSVNSEIAVNLIAFGVGGSILYQTGEQYHAQQAEVLKMVSVLLGCPENI